MSGQQPPTPPPAPPDQGDIPDEDSLFNDEKTSRAVDDIVAHESDTVLAAEDAAAAAANPVRKKRRGFWRSVGHFFKLWLGTAKGRWLTFFFLVLISGSVALVPEARYWTLNTAGVRSGASVQVVDEITQLPLPGVQVAVDGAVKATNENGIARFTDLKLGPTHLTISQPGFALISRRVTVGWGSNPYGTISLAATGVRYTLLVSDYISGDPVLGVQATAGSASAQSDEKGKIELTLEDPTAEGVTVTLSKPGYRTEQVKLKAANKTTTAKLVSDRKVVFAAHENGVYNIYKSDLDGNNREVLLTGTGNENGNLSLVTSPDGEYAALVSTRDNQHDDDGFLLSTLTLIKVSNGAMVTLAHAAQLQLIDWTGGRIVFEQVSSDTKSTSQYSLVSYDYISSSRIQLAAAPKLTGVFSARGALYYGIANDENNGSLQPGFYKINADGSGRQTIYKHEVWGGVRTDYNTLALQTADGWMAYDLPGDSIKAIDEPSTFTSRVYRDNADHSRSLWVEQGLLKVHSVADNKDTTVQTQGGLSYPVQWLGNIAVYRIVTGSETADYATSLLPGAPAHKITNVTNTYGFSTGQ